MIKGFTLSYSKGSAWLTVYPLQSEGRQVYSDEIRARMKILRIPPVRNTLIENIIQEASGEAVELGPWPGGEVLSARCSIEVAEDRMTATLTVTPPRPGGEEITVPLIEAALKETGILAGVDREWLRRTGEEKIYNRKIPIARGADPVHGKGSRVKYHFATQRIPYKELLYGRIDLKELNYIQHREEGDLLAELLPREEPQEGYLVTGVTLPAREADKGEKIIPGEGTLLEGERLLASREGNARLEKGMVLVEPVVTVNNVDYETGNLDFEGSVVVKGTVADGFSISAGGDIEVEKCVGRARLKAGRNIILKQGINGDNEAFVQAGGSVTTKYGESSQILCEGDLIVREALMHCSLMVKGNLLLAGGRAELLGGSAVIQGSLLCRKLGGIYEPNTSVVLGINPEDLENYKKLLGSIEAKRIRLDELDKKIGLIRKGAFGEDNREKLRQAEIQLEEEAVLVNGEVKEMVARSHEMGRAMPVRSESILAAEDRIYSGVQILFGFTEYTGNAGGKGVPSTVLSCHEGVIRDRGFDRANPPRIVPVGEEEIPS
ncbi:MAG: FapA family protein [Spirochaetales bacterium]|nr:FapA family protein [Spirochaetales bacterium]